METSVHPRVCGERVAYVAVQGVASRFIPACAGNASPTGTTCPTRPVHPRVCGERKKVAALTMPDHGSSPRVRGTHHRLLLAKQRDRFIPACAGNAANARCHRLQTPVHPRVCGERPRPSHVLGGLLRFIPACAGNAAFASFAVTCVTVHPRVCGERTYICTISYTGNGSSPRVRGTRMEALYALHPYRFIPACAGNARVARERRWAKTVHPRVCGERGRWPATTGHRCGSSPRVRGTPVPNWA